MPALSTASIQSFYQGLNACSHQSKFDNEFLENNSLESLYENNTEQWVDFLKNRLISTRKTAYDWTYIGSPSSVNWSRQKRHANYHWYHLAVHLAAASGKHVFQLIFSGVTIADNDYNYLSKPKHCASLIYSHDFRRLQHIDRMLILSEPNVFRFSNYDQDGKNYPISPQELHQIQSLFQENSCYEIQEIRNWDDFRSRYLTIWNAQSPTDFYFEDLIYPLFELTNVYFKELSNPELRGHTRKLLESFYDRVLKDLKPEVANYFYGQRIESAETRLDSLYLWDVFFALMDTDNLDEVLPKMVKLSVWITQQNPAMLIHHPEVEVNYSRQKIGNYLTCIKLCDEFIKLLRHRNELSAQEIEKIKSVVDCLSSDERDREWAQSCYERDLINKILEIMHLRETHNRTDTYVEVTKFKILAGSHEYVYYRQGANGALIRIAQLLEATGTWKRFGIKDYFQALMQDLESPCDSVTGEPLSKYPLSNYVRPEKDRRYLANLNNSVDSFQYNVGCFYDANSPRPSAFSPKVYEYIQAYSAPKFRKYPRLPEHVNYRLKASLLVAIVKLVNNALNYEATEDGEGYDLKEGLSDVRALRSKRIEYRLNDTDIVYQVRDSWNMEQIHFGYIEFENVAEKSSFVKKNQKDRLKFILNVAIAKGHARSNLIMTKYFRTYEAFVEFRKTYYDLPYEEQQAFNKICMDYAGTVRTVEEIWEGGFPSCMSTAAKWFSTIPLKYLYKLEYKADIESEPIHSKYLKEARRDSPGRKAEFVQNYLMNDISTSIDELYHFIAINAPQKPLPNLLSPPPGETSILGEQSIAELLSIADGPAVSSVRQFSVFSPKRLNENVFDSDTTSESSIEDSSLELVSGGSVGSLDSDTVVSVVSFFSGSTSPATTNPLSQATTKPSSPIIAHHSNDPFNLDELGRIEFN
ncbi:MAG: hypothetical protein ACO1N3_04115 [Gammaproteobacteria bacterium]